jgi:hypothetical protein
MRGRGSFLSDCLEAASALREARGAMTKKPLSGDDVDSLVTLLSGLKG